MKKISFIILLCLFVFCLSAKDEVKVLKNLPVKLMDCSIVADVPRVIVLCRMSDYSREMRLYQIPLKEAKKIIQAKRNMHIKEIKWVKIKESWKFIEILG